MPVPDDWQTTVQQLNNWALEKSEDSRLYDFGKELKQQCLRIQILRAIASRGYLVLQQFSGK
ncbi:hypothetical protein [Nostoc sp.]